MNSDFPSDVLLFGDSISLLKDFPDSKVHLILSDIPYGISMEDWDVLHSNTNSALLGHSPAQDKAGAIFKKRGKPLNGWSEADRQIPIQYYNWVCSWAKDWFRVLVPGGNAFVFAGRRLAPRCIVAFEEAGFTFKDMISWNKKQAPHRAQRLSVVYSRRDDEDSAQKWEGWKIGNLRPVFEPILWFSKPYKIGGTIADNVLQYGVGAYNETVFQKYGLEPNNMVTVKSLQSDTGLHPTQKPLKLMQFLIELTTIKGQMVLDPFCGSATTLVAALNTERHYIGIENNTDYYNVGIKRLIKAKEELESTLFMN